MSLINTLQTNLVGLNGRQARNSSLPDNHHPLTNGASTGWSNNGEEKWQQVGNTVGLMAGIGAGLAGYAILYEPFDVRLEHVTIRLLRPNRQLPAAGLRILHVSDSHFQGRDWREQIKIRRVRELTADLAPDVLVHTGDFWHNEAGFDNVGALLDALPRPKIASYAVLGNHDYSRYDMLQAISRMWHTFQSEERSHCNGRETTSWVTIAGSASRLLRFGQYVLNTPLDGKRTGFNNTSRLVDLLESKGYQVLHNRSVRLTHKPGTADGIDLLIAGVDDFVEGNPDISQALADTQDGLATILLSHNPDILQHSETLKSDLVLAGHTHGGQIVLPIFGALHTQAGLISRQQAAGCLRRGDTQIYINRGLGEGLPIRLGAPPQLTMITVLPSA